MALMRVCAASIASAIENELRTFEDWARNHECSPETCLRTAA